MSNKSSAIRSSRSSARYFPYSNSPSTVSTRRSRLSSSPGHDAESLSSDNHFGQSADYSSLHPTLNSAIGHAAVLPFVNSQQLSISTPQLEHYASAHQPADPSRLPFPQGLNRPPRPSTNSLFTEPTLSHAIYPLLNSQSLHAVQPSITINRPEDRIYQNYSVYQQTPHLPLGHASNSERRTVSFKSNLRNVLNNSPGATYRTKVQACSMVLNILLLKAVHSATTSQMTVSLAHIIC
jgi:hypothetical protein